MNATEVCGQDRGQNSTTGGQEKTPEGSPELEDALDGGVGLWPVAAGGAAIFCCLGFSNSFGTIQEYYSSHQFREESPDNIAWIGSLSAFIQFAAGMVGGPLFDRFGALV